MGLEHRGRGRKNGREKLDYDTINTDQASGRSYAGDAHKEGSEAFADSPEEIRELHIRKRSLDAMKKPELFYSYTVDVSVKREAELIHKLKNPQISLCKEVRYRFPESGETVLKERPLIIGTGPAGLFCGLMLARQGLPPCFAGTRKRSGRATEKGERVLQGGALDMQTNVQFGEGGAGTFSDGKLNTLVKDPLGRGKLVLELLPSSARILLFCMTINHTSVRMCWLRWLSICVKKSSAWAEPYGLIRR